MQVIPDNFDDLMLHLSNIISLRSSESQVNQEIDNILSQLSDILYSKSIFLRAKITNHEYVVKIERSIGIPTEQCQVINNHTINENNKQSLTNEIYTYTLKTKQNSSSMRSHSDIELFNIQEILELNLDMTDEFVMYFYFDTDPNHDSSVLTKILSFNRLFMESLMTKFGHLQIVQFNNLQMDGFNKSPSPQIVTDEDLNILITNSEAKILLGDPKHISPLNFINFLNIEEMGDEITEIKSLPVGQYYKINKVKLRLPAQSTYAKENVKVDLNMKKFINRDENVNYVININLQTEEDKVAVKQRISTDKDLIPLLKDFAKQYRENSEEAVEEGMELFFPGSFALILNEHQGPMILTTSPEIDQDQMYEEAIRLMAGLSTNQIIKQEYLTGITPWSYPQGELRWIAFYLDNENARGNTEIHLIGLVTKTNLLMTKPNIGQILLGILLGSMNSYIEIIKEDDADFCSIPFEHNRNYSTISLIKNVVYELRRDATEILAAYATG